MTEPAAVYSIVNFERFQHYKDRNPPWIKLHASTLDDYAFVRLTDAQKWHLVGLWILASKMENRLPMDEEWLARKIGASSDFAMQPLIDAGFVVLARRKSDARRAQAKCPSRQRRDREETETEYSDVFEEAWAAYPKRPNNNKADAFAAWNARLREGASVEQMLAGTLAYASYAEVMKLEPRYVKQAKTFFGPKRPYLDDYAVSGPAKASRDDFLARRGYVPRKAG